jgi:hypothetical protein
VRTEARVNLVRDVIRQIRCKFPKMDFMKNKHEDCVNFDNGTCRFFHFTNIDPKESACPHFKAKKKKVETESTDIAGRT